MTRNVRDGRLLVIGGKEVDALLSTQETLDITDRVLKEFAAGKILNPVKLHLPVYPDAEGYLNSMPTYHRENKDTGMKLVSVYRDNGKLFQVPVTMGTIILNDWETGMPYSVVDGTVITAKRTGAAAALKVKYLARKNSKIFTIVGAGAQGYSAFEMTMTCVGADFFEEVRVSDINNDNIRKFVDAASKAYPNLKFTTYNDNAAAVRGCDVVFFCAGAPLSIIGQCEITDGMLAVIVCDIVTRDVLKQFDKFYTDFTECVMERFNVMGRNAAAANGWVFEDLTPDLVTSQVGNVMNGTIPGRESDREKIITVDCGIGAEDVGCASYVYQKAIEQGKGTFVDFTNL